MSTVSMSTASVSTVSVSVSTEFVSSPAVPLFLVIPPPRQFCVKKISLSTAVSKDMSRATIKVALGTHAWVHVCIIGAPW